MSSLRLPSAAVWRRPVSPPSTGLSRRSFLRAAAKSSLPTTAAAAATVTPPTSINKGYDAPVDWVEATSHFFQDDTRPIMLFDGVCNLCNGGVRFVKAHDSKRIIRFEALQSDAGRQLLQRSGRSPDDITSVVLVEKDRSYIKSDAVLKIMEYLDIPFPQLALFFRLFPLFIRDQAYEVVADNRYAMFGESDTCEVEW